MNYSMDAIDQVRKRAKVGYEAAKEALDFCDGDVLDAIIYLEKRGDLDQNIIRGMAERLKEIVNEGFISQIQVIKNGQKLFDIPVVAGVAMMALWTIPFTAVLITAIASKCDIRIVKRDGAVFSVTDVTAEKFSSLLQSLKHMKCREENCGENCEEDLEEECDAYCPEDEEERE